MCIFPGTQETSTGSATEASKEARRQNLTLEEENAIRYASGYVMMKMKKRFDSKGMMDVSECLMSMREGTEEKGESNDANSYFEYSRFWIDLVDRGGLFKVKDEVFKFFLELELCVYPSLQAALKSGSACNKDGLLQQIKVDEDVLFAWSLLTLYISDHDSNMLLRAISELWITIRGFAITSQLLEEYKQAAYLSLKGKRSLRKELKQAGQQHNPDGAK